MGITIDIHCDACGWQEGFRLGTGAGMARLGDVLDLVPEEHRIRIRSIVSEHTEHAEDFELRLYRCPDCGRLFERMQVSLLYDGAQRWESLHRCDDCNAALEPLADPDEIPTLPCPDCGVAALSVADATFWD